MIKVGVSGDVGSFSEEVGLIYIKKAALTPTSIVHLINMDGVLAALVKDEIDYGVFPVANKGSGLVRQALDAMGRYPFAVIDTIDINVEQCLFAKEEMAFDQIKAIYSFAPAIVQCKNILNEALVGIPIVDWGDMAKAARDLSNGVIASDCAIIGSQRAAEAYGLKILASGIQDIKINTTMFIVVKRLK